jgi:hypothetical protein
LVRTRSRPFLAPAFNILWLAQSMEKGHAEGDVRSISHEPHWRPGKRRICDGRHVGTDVSDSYYRAKGYQPDFDKLRSKDEYEAAEGAKAKKSTRAR